MAGDSPNWDRFLKKHKQLKDSTLGNLISILSRHSLAEADLNYLRWLKSKRDFYIHQYFQTGPWPGDLNGDQIERVCRTLGALELVFHRGAQRMMNILGKAGLMDIRVIPGSGVLAFNPDLLNWKPQ